MTMKNENGMLGTHLEAHLMYKTLKVMLKFTLMSFLCKKMFIKFIYNSNFRLIIDIHFCDNFSAALSTKVLLILLFE